VNTRLVFAGEAIVDLVMRVPALPERGGDMLAASSSIQVGGGFNIMAAALPPEALLFVDPGPLVADIPGTVLGPVLSRSDWWSCNQREAALLTEASEPVEAARRLARRTGRAGVIVRAGPSGCVLALREPASAGAAHPGLSLGDIPAPAVTAVDTAGAGDAHAGVFLAGLAAGLPPAAAARRANAAAALTVTRAGPATSPSRAELDRFLAQGRAPGA
jgi:sugar/nucleoside kinase (ribokinase family)